MARVLLLRVPGMWRAQSTRSYRAYYLGHRAQPRYGASPTETAAVAELVDLARHAHEFRYSIDAVRDGAQELVSRFPRATVSLALRDECGHPVLFRVQEGTLDWWIFELEHPDGEDLPEAGAHRVIVRAPVDALAIRVLSCIEDYGEDYLDIVADAPKVGTRKLAHDLGIVAQHMVERSRNLIINLGRRRGLVLAELDRYVGARLRSLRWEGARARDRAQEFTEVAHKPTPIDTGWVYPDASLKPRRKRRRPAQSPVSPSAAIASWP